MCFKSKPPLSDNTVDGRNPANQLIGSLSHYLQGFIHVRWCGISFINRSTVAILTSGNFPMFQFHLHHLDCLRRPKMRRKRWPPREKSLSAEAIPIFFLGGIKQCKCMYVSVYISMYPCMSPYVRMSVCLFFRLFCRYWLLVVQPAAT